MLPHVSLLWPFLFCIFFNDFPLQISDGNVSNDILADNSSFYTSGGKFQSVETSPEGSLSEVSDWCDTNAMIIHPTKTKLMVIATRQRHQLNPLQLQPILEKTCIVHEHRVLGVTIIHIMKSNGRLVSIICIELFRSENVVLLS